jgi:hypothetical protein
VSAPEVSTPAAEMASAATVSATTVASAASSRSRIGGTGQNGCQDNDDADLDVRHGTLGRLRESPIRAAVSITRAWYESSIDKPRSS